MSNEVEASKESKPLFVEQSETASRFDATRRAEHAQEYANSILMLMLTPICEVREDEHERIITSARV